MNALKNLNIEQQLAVMQLTYQLVACANNGHMSDEDMKDIDIMMKHMGYENSMNVGNALWNQVNIVDPFSAFEIVANFSDSEKLAFKYMINDISRAHNANLRRDIARQIFNRTGIK